MSFRVPVLGLLGAFVASLLLAAGSASVSPDTALAGRKPYEDKKLGYRIRIEDSYVQNPPKLTADEAYVVGDWYEDSAKFDAPGLRPTFRIFWFAEPKNAVTAEAPAPGETPPASEDEQQRAFREQFRVESFDEALDRILEFNTHLFGAAVPMKDRWAEAEKDKTASKIPFDFVEVNPPTKRKPKDGSDPAHGYCYLARLTLDRPDETIHVGFWGSCAVNYAKSRFQREFAQIVRSFEELKSATDSRNEGAQADLSQDREARYEQIAKTKLVKGWKIDRTANYILVYSDEVDPKLVKQIGAQIEAIRSQVYEVMFPPDKPVTAFSIVRVCKDRDQYMGYGAPGGSAGYWDRYSEELVFYEDQRNKKDSLRVLYHEAFHQYIHYSVGDFSPHSWFNEGHGDYFAGHNYEGGRFKTDVFQWRVSGAKTWKRSPVRPPLREWVNWTQAEYYGRNKAGLEMVANYELGWSLVYFLRTTKKPEYQGVLDRYFNSLKGAVTRKREAEEAWKKKLEEWEKQKAENPDLPPLERDATSDVGDESQWLKQANEDAFKGIDWDKIERDWLAADY